MQTCKFLSVICATALLSGAASLRADETEAQAKAREALRQKMAELDAQQKSKPAPPAPVTPPPPPPAPPPVVTPARPIPSRPLRQPVSAPPAGTPVPEPIAPPPVLPPPPVVDIPQKAGSENIARARDALRQKMTELDAQQTPQKPVAAPEPPKAIQTTAQFPEKPSLEINPAPPAQITPPSNVLEPPPSAVSASKETRLAELLQRYKTDAITPEEYHKMRAAILAEP